MITNMSNLRSKRLLGKLKDLYKEFFFLRFKSRLGDFKKNHMFSLFSRAIARKLTRRNSGKNILN